MQIESASSEGEMKLRCEVSIARIAPTVMQGGRKMTWLRTLAWLFTTVWSVALLGACATPAATGSAPSRGATESVPSSASGLTYRSATVGAPGKGTIFFLKRAEGGRWIASPVGDLKDPDTERVVYDAAAGTIALFFDKNPRSGKTTQSEFCVVIGVRKETERSSGYTFCSTSFRTKADFDPDVAAGRVLIGAMTLGASELVTADQNYSRLDTRAVLDAAVAANVRGQYATYTYRAQYANASTKVSLQQFVEQYLAQKFDPDGLIAQARARIINIDALDAEYSSAAAKVAPLAKYLTLYMPSRPENYCSPFKPGSSEFELCNANARSIVANLAEPKARSARSQDVCIAAASKYMRDAASKCRAFVASRNCRAALGDDPGGQRACAVLSGRRKL